MNPTLSKEKLMAPTVGSSSTDDSEDAVSIGTESTDEHQPTNPSSTSHDLEHLFDRKKCTERINNITQPYLNKGQVPTMMSRQRRRNVRDMMVNLTVHRPHVHGDWVETGTWQGGASLLAALVQRVALQTPSCGHVLTRTIWLADSFEGLPAVAANETKRQNYSKTMDPPGSYLIKGGVDTVKTTFQQHGFQTDGSGEVPIKFLVGWFQDTLPDALIEDIAVLRLDGDLYASTLQSLFALYRRVRINGTVIIDDYGHWPQCQKAIDEFFVDSKNLTLRKIDYTGRWFTKENVHVRVPPKWNTEMIAIDERVVKAWKRLSEWHTETTKSYVGHVGGNRYQTYRYIEAARHVIQRKQQLQAETPVHVHVCETGFNGGHSAMLFLSLHDPTNNIVHVHYHGWDLGRVGSSKPAAAKMLELYGEENFHVVWGDSKQSLPHIQSMEHQFAGRMKDEKCDIIVIDGEHKAEGVTNDLHWLLQVANPGAVVFGDDCAPYHRQVPASKKMLMTWNAFVEEGKLVAVANYRNPQLSSPGFVEGLVPDHDTGDFVLGL